MAITIQIFLKFSKRVGLEEELRIGRKSKKQTKHLSDGDELPGDRDPDTIFKLGEIGNYEPKEAQGQPGNYGIYLMIQ